MPSQYQKDEAGPFGFGAISSLLRGSDGMHYGLVHVATPRRTGAQATGNCAFMMSDLADPTSFRAWNGSHFSVRFPSPYPGATQNEAPICPPVTLGAGERDGSSHPVPRRLVGFPDAWPRFLLLGLTGSHVTYSFSWSTDFRDAVTAWSEPEVIHFDLPSWPGSAGRVLYPVVLDSSSPSMSGANMEGDNFELVGNRTAWLYIVVDRKHIVRRRLHFYDSSTEVSRAGESTAHIFS